jgi:hypothetical protein
MKILLVVQPWRFDYYSYLSKATHIDWSLLWFERQGQVEIDPSGFPLQFKEILYWQQFKTPGELLDKVKPDRILFFEIIDLRQIALIVAAGAKGIPTYYSDHGAAADKDATLKYLHTKTFWKNTLPYVVKRFKNNLKDSIKSKYFYFSVKKGFHSYQSYLAYLALPFKMLGSPSHKVLLKSKFPERIPKVPIIFNQPNFDDFQTYTGVKKEDVYISGVPFFDRYHPDNTSTGDYVVYIEHPYYEESLAEWTLDHHRTVAEHLFNFAEKRKCPLYIKLHPRSDKKLWEGHTFNSEYVTILQNGDYTDLYLNAKLILGYSSSLINGFLCAKKNVVLLGWNPVPHIEGADFSTTGLCHSSLYPEELEQKFEYWLSHNLAVDNEVNYNNFLIKFNFPFDGRAVDRIIKVLEDPAHR